LPAAVADALYGDTTGRRLGAIDRLRAMVDSARGSRVEVYAQNMHEQDEGAFTGEISAPMLAEIGVPLTPVRLKCAMLGLTTLKVALHKAKGTPLPEGLAGFDELDLA